MDRSIDPLWKCLPEDARRTRNWRIEGKHESRWIRRYGTSQIQTLADWAAQEDLKITLSHSQRWEQLEEFKQLLNRKKQSTELMNV